MSNLKIGLLLLAIVGGMLGGFVSSKLFASQARETGAAHSTAEIIVPPEGLTFRTTDGKPLAKLVSTEGKYGHRNTLFIFNEAGNQAVALSAISGRGDVSVYDNRNRGAAISMFAKSDGGQLTIMGDLKAGIQLSSGKDGGLITVNESDGFPALTLGTIAHRGDIQIMANGKVLWRAPK